MSAHKPDIHCTAIEEYHGYQAILIAFDVENIAVVTNKINTIKAASHIGKVFLIGSLALEIPLVQSVADGRSSLGKVTKWGITDNNHVG